MSYKSKHTGAQVDEAVSKVLNGEVGGGATGTTPDWNAKEGEDGYIKNKPLTISNDNIEYYTTPEFNELDEPTEDGYYYVSTQPISLTDEDALIIKSFYSSVSYTEYKDDVYHFTFKEQTGIYEFTFDSVKVVLNFDDNIIEFRTNDSTDRGEYLYKFVYPNEIYKIASCFIPDTIARKSDLENLSNGSTGKSKFQLYQENGGRFFTNENLYNIFDALRNECSDYYFDLEIYTPLESGNTYTFDDLGLTYANFIGIIYGGRNASVYINDDDAITLINPGELTDEYLWLESESAQLRVDLVAKTVEFDYNVSD